MTPDGIDVGLEGLTPDEVVEADWDQVSDAADPVLDAGQELAPAPLTEQRPDHDEQPGREDDLGEQASEHAGTNHGDPLRPW